MSAVTLETLKADCERLYLLLLGPAPLGICPEFAIEEINNTISFQPVWREYSAKLLELAHVYMIARDQGMGAAVLWKLQNGGAQ